MRYDEDFGASDADAGSDRADLAMAFGGIMVILFAVALLEMGDAEGQLDDVEERFRAREEEHAAAMDEANGRADFWRDRSKQIGTSRDEDRARHDEEIGDIMSDRDYWKGRAQQSSGNLEARDLDLIIIVDGSWSMQPEIDAIRERIEEMAETLALVAPRFRLGIVVHRQQGNYTFPLQEIGPTEDGVKHPGMDALLSFANDPVVQTFRATKGDQDPLGELTEKIGKAPKLSALVGQVDPGKAIDAGLAMLEGSDAVRTVCLIGDMGMWELKHPKTIQLSERREAKAIAERVAAFSGPDARFVSYFTGQSRAELKHRAESEQFFRDLAAAAGTSGTYFDDARQMTSIIVSTCVRR